MRTKLLLTFPLAVATMFGGDLTGYISDAWCGKSNANDTPASSQCAKECVKNGAEPVFVNTADGKVLKIANKDKVMNFVGAKVTVAGKVDGETLTVATVQAAK